MVDEYVLYIYICLCFGLGCQGDGREEDGFLVIGETAIERSTVGPQSRPHTSIAAEDLPPSYSQVVTAINNYQPRF